jgi:hypothetical protein
MRFTPFSKRKFTAERKQEVTAEVVRSMIAYEPETGALTWVQSPRYGIPVGSPVGCINGRGYVVVTLLGKKFTGHRLAWLLHHGEWPREVIDHINRNPSDNRIANLRDVSQAVNLKNRADVEARCCAA